MKRLSLNGHLYATPFIGLPGLRPLTEPERIRLCDSIRTHGVKQNLIVYESDRHGRSIIDGINRAEIGTEEGIDSYPVTNLGRIGDDTAEELAYSLNADRRQFSLEEMAGIASERRARVVIALATGKSLRQVAKDEGVSHTQIANDAKANEQQNVNGFTGSAFLYRTCSTLERGWKALDEVERNYADRVHSLARGHGIAADTAIGDMPYRVVRAVLSDLAASAVVE